MVIPSGMAQLRALAGSERERQRAEQSGEGRHHDRAKAQEAGLFDRIAGVAVARSASSAKSTIMMAFFLTMPISNKTPIAAMTVNSVSNGHNASAAPTLAENSVERMVSGWIRLS